MARTKNLLLEGMSGTFGKQMVIKQYKYGTVVSRVPDMTGIKPSRDQKQSRNRFKEAVAYAKSILNDAKKSAAYKKSLKKGETVYHKAIKEYLAKNK
jgi:hypothetical protein